MEKDFNLLEKFDDKEIDFLYQELRKVWYFINDKFPTSVRVQDEDYNAFSDFCFKVSCEFGKRHGL